MAVGERERRELQEALVDTIGPEQSDTLMSYLPPTGWADVATKHDLDSFAAQLRAEMHVLGSDLRAEMSDLRAELRAGTSDLRSELHQALRQQMQWMLMLTITIVAAVIATGLLT